MGICTAAPDAGSTSPGRAAGCYALPVDTARCLVDQILLHGRVVRPALGVTLAPPDILASHAMDGVLVLEVPAGYAAHAAGLRPTHRDIFGQLILGDVIVALDGRPVANAMELGQALDEKRVGQRVGVAVLRDGKQMNLTLTLGERVLGVVDD